MRTGRQHRQRDVPDEAGDVEERRQSKDGVLRRQPDPAFVYRRREHDVAMRVHRRLRFTGGPRGVDHERHVVAGDVNRLGHLSGACVYQLEEVGDSVVTKPRPRQDARGWCRGVEQIEW